MLTWVLLSIFGAGAFLYVYWFVWRPFASRVKFLRIDRIYARLDQIEAGPRAKLRVTFSGLKRKLAVHVTTLIGLLPFIHDTVLPWLGAQDITPFLDSEDQWMFQVGMVVAGQVLGWLISISPQPPGEVNPSVVEAVVAKSSGNDDELALDAAEATGMNQLKEPQPAAAALTQ